MAGTVEVALERRTEEAGRPGEGDLHVDHLAVTAWMPRAVLAAARPGDRRTSVDELVGRFVAVTTYGVRQRVACYVTRSTERGAELLVFDHRDDDPDDPSGTQIPAGGMRRFEAITDAAAREIDEETGLADTTFVAQVGFVELGLHEAGGPSMTTYVHVTAPGGGPDEWEHQVGGDGEDAGMVFRCRWEPLPLGFELAGGQGQFVVHLTP
jgi:8-oxo-dGTP pyrophosphatase MutT (NUDIX family)